MPASSEGERIAKIEAIVERVETRGEQIAERTHSHANTLTVLSANVEQIKHAVQRIETRQEANYQAVRSDLAPVKADYDARRAVAEANKGASDEAERTSRVRHPWYIAILSTMLTGVVGAIGWAAGMLHLGMTKP